MEQVNALAIRRTVAQRKEASDKALAGMEEALTKFKEASEALMEAEKNMRKAEQTLIESSGVSRFESAISHLFSSSRSRNNYATLPKTEEIQKAQDIDLWRGVLETSSFWQFMDAEAREEFKNALRKETPQFTEENALATLLHVVPQLDGFFRRGLVNAFCRLNSQYKSNDQFKIGKKIVLERIYDQFWSIHDRSRSRLDDLERAFYTLDKKRFGEEETLCQTLERFSRSRWNRTGPARNEMETRYFSVKVFKNGNVHLMVKDKSILDACNREIARHFGDSLARSGK